MEVGEFIRERIRQARSESGLNQRRMAKLLGVSQSAISDIERGRVQINAKDLAQIAKLLRKPIAYFFPAELAADTKLEAELLNYFRGVSEIWQQRIVAEARAVEKMHRWLAPYEQAGIPEEFYDLIWQDVESIGWTEQLEGFEPPEQVKEWTEEELITFQSEQEEKYKRYREWKNRVQADWESREDET